VLAGFISSSCALQARSIAVVGPGRKRKIHSRCFSDRPRLWDSACGSLLYRRIRRMPSNGPARNLRRAARIFGSQSTFRCQLKRRETLADSVSPTARRAYEDIHNARRTDGSHRCGIGEFRRAFNHHGWENVGFTLSGGQETRRRDRPAL